MIISRLLAFLDSEMNQSGYFVIGLLLKFMKVSIDLLLDHVSILFVLVVVFSQLLPRIFDHLLEVRVELLNALFDQ